MMVPGGFRVCGRPPLFVGDTPALETTARFSRLVWVERGVAQVGKLDWYWLLSRRSRAAARPAASPD